MKKYRVTLATYRRYALAVEVEADTPDAATHMALERAVQAAEFQFKRSGGSNVIMVEGFDDGEDAKPFVLPDIPKLPDGHPNSARQKFTDKMIEFNKAYIKDLTGDDDENQTADKALKPLRVKPVEA